LVVGSNPARPTIIQVTPQKTSLRNSIGNA
jgi:hypothetical protein